MGELIRIRPHLRICENCIHGKLLANDIYYSCTRPGGWHFDCQFRHCADFQSREKREHDPSRRQSQSEDPHL